MKQHSRLLKTAYRLSGVTLALALGFTSYAVPDQSDVDNIQNEIDKAQDEIDKTQSEIDATKDKKDKLQQAKSEMEDYLKKLNQHSLTVVRGVIEPYAKECAPGTALQFLRTGYFCKDPDSTAELPVFNRTVGLRDAFAKAAK